MGNVATLCWVKGNEREMIKEIWVCERKHPSEGLYGKGLKFRILNERVTLTQRCPPSDYAHFKFEFNL